MNEYLFDVKLFAAIRVRAATETDAREMLMKHIDGNSANLGAWPNGDPIMAEVSCDVVAYDDMVEINGEPV